MAVEIVTVPDLGGAETVDVIELSIAQGDAVALEDSLLVLESDKATMDVPSPFAGTLVKFLVADGDTVKVGDPIAEIEVAGQQTEASAQPAKAAADTATAVIEEQPEPVKQPEAATVSAEQAGGLAEQLILVPDIGSEDQIDVIEISVAIGDQVEEGDTLLVLESDKATMDVPSSHSGTVIKIIAAEGDKLTTGSEVAVLQVSQTNPNAEPAPVAEVQAPQAVVEPTAQPAIAPQAP
ncbi:biotin/lipoyl-binding protein, partial [Porticoccaceae bacterium]|nr:biotin/lipoyl-binding protein [Porticoccaceae bacterium]